MRAESSAIRRRAGGHRGTQAGPADALNERYRNILDAASVLFAERGYASTSIRDIGERVGLLGGSLYHHIKSKEDLFLKVHDTALRHAADAIQLAVSRVDDPWDRLQVACTTLFEIQVDRNSMTMPLMNDLGAVPEALRIRLIRTRDEFEEIFAGIVEALPMPAGIDRKGLQAASADFTEQRRQVVSSRTSEPAGVHSPDNAHLSSSPRLRERLIEAFGASAAFPPAGMLHAAALDRAGDRTVISSALTVSAWSLEIWQVPAAGCPPPP